MSNNLMLSRKSFALLEVMIALLLIVLLSGYFVRYPFLSLKKEREALYQLEFERLWELKLVEIEARLPSMASSLKSTLTEAPIEEEKITLSFSKDKPVTLSRKYRLILKKTEYDENKHPYFLVELYPKKTKKGRERETPSNTFFVRGAST